MVEKTAPNWRHRFGVCAISMIRVEALTPPIIEVYSEMPNRRSPT